MAKTKARDDLVMATNNSSIVSKRSVERLYFPGQQEFYRYFVKKFQRRAPLINRGYHLRLHLIDALVRRFLQRPTAKPKVVVNLGCGSDVLPWQCLSRYPDACRGVRFVDIDFPDVMAAKKAIVSRTPELQGLLTNLVFPPHPRVLVQSDQYCQIACDLRQLAVLREDLAGLVDTAHAELLFVAEVSITYMEPEAADALIQWAGSFQAEFCLLEQVLPGGAGDPFARTMLQHFDKLNTPLKCVHRYPTLAEQQKRFVALGWPATYAWTLWQAWQDPFFLSAEERQQLDKREMFDEWEEFAHFASHYLLLYASTTSLHYGLDKKAAAASDVVGAQGAAVSSIRMACSPIGQQKSTGLRRFGVPLAAPDVLGRPCLGNLFGVGSEGRLPSCDIFAGVGNDDAAASLADLQQAGPAARLFATLTDMGHAGCLLAGGRGSLTGAFRDVWLVKKDVSYRWQRAQDLPLPLFRHAVTSLHNAQLALLAGGKSSPSTVFAGYLVYHPVRGWTACAVSGALRPPPVFGAVLFCTGRDKQAPDSFCGILAGGMTADGVVHRQAYRWVLAAETSTIRFELAPGRLATPLLSRFGAACTQLDGWTVVVGGITAEGSVLGDADIVRYRVGDDGTEDVCCLDMARHLGADTLRPVLVGASVVGTGNGEVAIAGGGMTCFSMGTVWSPGLYTFSVRPSGGTSAWAFAKTLSVAPEEVMEVETPTQARPAVITQIPRRKLTSAEEFQQVLQGGLPVVLEGLDLGVCTAEWNAASLAAKVGTDRQVIVHESTSQAMDFVSKNFRYTTETFGAFAQEVGQGKKLYLRALSAEKPSDLPTRLDVDFPELADDFVLPPPLAFVRERLFSSVLRISGPVNMWLHYDVLANVYAQIHGSKRFILFPPSDVTHLGFQPGASSSSVDVFSSLSSSSSSMARCRPYEAVVGPGDVLFLPQLWLHTASPLSAQSVAVNVFFRDLDHGYAAGRDVYANRDLAAYERARQDVAKTAHAFSGLPRETRAFYLSRLAEELAQRAAE